jgi:heme exporter protein A
MIHAAGLSKRFGTRAVLTRIDLEVAAGDVVLVTGPNGSGKTTLLRILAGLGAPSGGTLEVAVDRARLGFLGHEPLLYRQLTADENLELYARLYRIARPAARIEELLGRYDLLTARSRRVASYSRGMIQRLALCRALLHGPELLLLDEPHTALDAAGAELVDAELAALAGVATLVVATHDPDRVAPIATTRLPLGGSS